MAQIISIVRGGRSPDKWPGRALARWGLSRCIVAL